MDDIDIFLDPNGDDLSHYGTPRHSGRYPWGSGDNPYQHQDERSKNRYIYKRNEKFLDDLSKLTAQGLSETEIAKQLHCKNTSELRAKRKAATNTNKKIDIAEIKRLQDKGYTTAEISRRLEKPYGTIKSLMSSSVQKNVNKYSDTIDILKEAVADKKYVYVGKGTAGSLNITDDHLTKSLKELENQGYTVKTIMTAQVSDPDQMTEIKVLAPPGETKMSISKNRESIQPIYESAAADKNTKIFGIEKPTAIDPSRVYVRYPDEGGGDQDGTIQIRRGVPDLYLGDNTLYSQVRINVGDKSYLKGMAIYGDDIDIPDGYDVVFNTSKPRGTDVMTKVFKPLKTVDEKDPDSPVDWANPFGAAIKPRAEGGQYDYIDISTGESKLSAINKVNTEGDWEDWSKTLSSQFLSKQPAKLIKQQLDKTYDEQVKQFDAIMELPDSPVKSRLLTEFAGSCDTNAVHLKASGFAGQGQKVILPLTTLNENEVYAPSYPDGTQLILIRHPHQGTFEIPLVTVNNKNSKGHDIYGNAQDLIAIRPETAQQLSGADFDGDTVTAIPVTGHANEFNIEKARAELQFDPKAVYKKADNAPKTGKEKEADGRKFDKGLQMGSISNLITDMTLQDAPIEDIVKATKHALVVIDAEKHNLDWEKSEAENDIRELKARYQGGPNRGAATLISRASSVEYVPERNRFRQRIDPETGEIIHVYTNATTVDKRGKVKPKTQESTKMAERKDARELMSNPEGGFIQEELYADYANKAKALANRARKESLNNNYVQNKSAAQTFAKEVSSLNAKLNNAKKNKPYENLAQIKANAVINDAKKHMDKDLPKDEYKKQLKKIRTQALKAARAYWGAEGGKSRINISPSEWEAIQAGALTKNNLEEILKNTNSETLTNYAFPKETVSISPGLRALIYTMDNADATANGQKYTLADIADRTGLSTATVSKVLRNEI